MNESNERHIHFPIDEMQDGIIVNLGEGLERLQVKLTATGKMGVLTLSHAPATDTKPIKHQLRRDQIANMVSLYEAGVSMRGLAQIFVVSPATVHHTINGQSDKSAAYTRERKRKTALITANAIKETLRRYREGESIQMAAHALQMDIHIVAAIFQCHQQRLAQL